MSSTMVLFVEEGSFLANNMREEDKVMTTKLSENKATLAEVAFECINARVKDGFKTFHMLDMTFCMSEDGELYRLGVDNKWHHMAGRPRNGGYCSYEFPIDGRERRLVILAHDLSVAVWKPDDYLNIVCVKNGVVNHTCTELTRDGELIPVLETRKNPAYLEACTHGDNHKHGHFVRRYGLHDGKTVVSVKDVEAITKILSKSDSEAYIKEDGEFDTSYVRSLLSAKSKGLSAKAAGFAKTKDDLRKAMFNKHKEVV